MNVEAEARHLVGEAGLPPDPALIRGASEYLGRTRRGRRYGLIGGLVLGIGPLADHGQVNLVLPLMLAGYLLGLLVSELLAPRPGRRPRRSAALQPRQAGDLLPRWARVAFWAVLVPVLAVPLLALVHRGPGATRIATASYSCWVAVRGWPGMLVLVTAAFLGAAGLAIAELSLAALARRARPADDPVAARLDDVIRGMSARAVAGGAAALGLTLLGTIGQAVTADFSALLCSAHPGPVLSAYPWAAPLTPWLGLASFLSLVAALVILAVCRRRQDPRRRLIPGHAL
jgi:hypothetical protein